MSIDCKCPTKDCLHCLDDLDGHTDDKDRLRSAAQILIEEIGASGPENVETTARRASYHLRGLKAERDGARRVLEDARSRLAVIVDEAFGPQEVLGIEDLLTRLEHLLCQRNAAKPVLVGASEGLEVVPLDDPADMAVGRTRS